MSLNTEKYKVFKWYNLCNRMSQQNNIEGIHEIAEKFGIPREHWDDKKKVCEMITPRMDEILEKDHKCSNNDDDDLFGTKMANIPEYLKYSVTVPTKAGDRIVCRSILDLYNHIKHNPNDSMEPYRLFKMDKEEIINRYNFLSGVMNNDILNPKDDLPVNTISARLRKIWMNLDYPSYTLDEILNADKDTLITVCVVLQKQDGIGMTKSELTTFRNVILSGTTQKVLHSLIDFLERKFSTSTDVATLALAVQMALETAKSSLPSYNRHLPYDYDPEDAARLHDAILGQDYVTVTILLNNGLVNSTTANEELIYSIRAGNPRAMDYLLSYPQTDPNVAMESVGESTDYRIIHAYLADPRVNLPLFYSRFDVIESISGTFCRRKSQPQLMPS